MAAVDNRNRYSNGFEVVHRAWNRVCDAWNTVIYASQILRVLQEEEDSSVELLCRRLVENEPKLLQLGWLMVGDYYTTKELDDLVEAMIHNTSVNTISIGWSLRPYSIHRILGAIRDMPQVEDLSLVLHSSLKAESLELLKKYHPNLKRLQIQNVQLRRLVNTAPISSTSHKSPIISPPSACHTDYHHNVCNTHLEDYDDDMPWDDYDHDYDSHHHNMLLYMLFTPRELCFQDYNIVDLVSDWDQLDSLQLLDCDLQDYQICQLVRHAKKRPKPWRELSVAYNPHVGMKALVRLVQDSNSKRIDMTSCNITPPGARALVKALEDLHTHASLRAVGIDPLQATFVKYISPLESLCLARNVYMGYGALPLITAASKRLLRLDITHCQLPVEKVWEAILAAAKIKPRRMGLLGYDDGATEEMDYDMIVLQRLSLQGYTEYPGLQDFLRHNIPSLHTLQLSSSSSSTPISKSTKQELLAGISANYYIQEVVVFVDATTTMSSEWWNFDFALQLNRIGRRILHKHTRKRQHWSHVLEEASMNPDCLYWLLRNGVGNWNATGYSTRSSYPAMRYHSPY